MKFHSHLIEESHRKRKKKTNKNQETQIMKKYYQSESSRKCTWRMGSRGPKAGWPAINELFWAVYQLVLGALDRQALEAPEGASIRSPKGSAYQQARSGDKSVLRSHFNRQAKRPIEARLLGDLEGSPFNGPSWPADQLA